MVTPLDVASYNEGSMPKMIVLKNALFRNVQCSFYPLQVFRHTNRKYYSTQEAYMSAWQIHQYGGPEQLKLYNTVEIPTVQRPWDVLVKVHAASINPIDGMMLGGYGAATMNAFRRLTCSFSEKNEFPLILGRDFSGVVVATGKAIPQSKFKPGDEVWGAGDPWRQGAFAEYTVVNALQISHKPKQLGHTDAATMPYVGATCWSALCTLGTFAASQHDWKEHVEAKTSRSQSLFQSTSSFSVQLQQTTQPSLALVIGGSGGIGTFSIQLLKAWGAEVTSTCAGDAVMKVLELGADIALDYTKEDVFLELKRLPQFDLILDAVDDNSEQCMPLLKKYANARYITLKTPFLRNNDDSLFPLGLIKTGITLGTHNIKALQQGQTYRWGLFMPNGYAMKQIAELVDAGKILPVIEKVYPFSKLSSGLEKVATKHNRGKSVLDVSDQHVDVQHEEPEQQHAQANT
ncbi:hypothetical protein LSH36_9g09067 [Paralvinella palmiformis]|uniref:Enoyl reductase (ER) domain-containing protein n=1 Tax=Paralvinella palmiformis TaxID=53620 RepID=A0AAD9NI87_9ANNE|nr:hypothetical protein LSH36_9g09067 [Paralvinella palmiformis]